MDIVIFSSSSIYGTFFLFDLNLADSIYYLDCLGVSSIIISTSSSRNILAASLIILARAVDGVFFSLPSY